MSERALRCQKLANQIRLKMLDMTQYGNDTMHWGGSFSCAEIYAVLYDSFLNIMNENTFEKKDKFLLSKGHAALGAYAAMNLVGMLSDEWIAQYQGDGSPISELMEYNEKLGFETSGGSLGINPSYGVGLALLAKKKGYSYKTVVVTGDGEIDEGAVWEAVMSASQYRLDNLILIVDANTLQSDGPTKDIMSWENLEERLNAFGWNVVSVDGHNCEELIDALENHCMNNKPKAIIANTVKGKGVSFFENNYLWHDKILKGEELKKAREEVEAHVAV